MTAFLIPPKRVRTATGVFRLPRCVTLDVDPSFSTAAQLLQRVLAGRDVACRLAERAPHVALRRGAVSHGAEGYALTIASDGITITAANDAGAWYAVQTLRELLRAHGLALPCGRIDDWPDFARRGVFLDISRGRVPTLACLLELVPLLAHWKINELQFNVENTFRFRRHPAIGQGYSPLTPADITVLQRACKAHHIRLVGAFASFGHTEKILQLPRYTELGELPGHQGFPGGTTLCPTDPRSIKLIEELYAEYAPLFEATDFNIMCDEPWELGKGRSAARARRIGVGRLYVEFIKKLDRLCRRHGKRTNMWTDVVLAHPESLSELPRDIVMLNWTYALGSPLIKRTAEIVRNGFPVVVCPGTHGWNSHGCRLDTGMRNIAEFTAEGLRRGAEGLLNTDWGDNGHRNLLAVSLHNMAWGGAQGWNHRGTRAEGFSARFCHAIFGLRDGCMADAIRTLGTTMNTTTWRSFDRVLYDSLMRPVQWGYDFFNQALKQLPTLDADCLDERYEMLDALKWPALPARTTPFLQALREEYRMATQLDLLAAERCRTLKAAQAGQRVSAARWRALIRRTHATAEALRTVWLLNNRPSRLREHLAGFRATIRGYERSIRGRG